MKNEHVVAGDTTGRHVVGVLVPQEEVQGGAQLLMANVPQDHGGSGPSSCIAILWIVRYLGRVGGSSPLSKKDSRRAQWSCVSKASREAGGVVRGSRSVQYSGQR